jgi:hypothetical protein
MFDNKFTKRDALAESVKKVMLESQIQRQAEATLNEELGISSKKALPHEYHTQYDALLEAKLAPWRTPKKVREKLEGMYGPAQTIHMGDGTVTHIRRVLNDEGYDGYIGHKHEYDPVTQEVGKLIKHSKPPKSFFKEHTQYDAMLKEAIHNALSEGQWPKKNMIREEENLPYMGTGTGSGSFDPRPGDYHIVNPRTGKTVMITNNRKDAERTAKTFGKDHRVVPAEKFSNFEKYQEKPKGVRKLEEKKIMSKPDAALRIPRKKVDGGDLAALRAGEHLNEKATKSQKGKVHKVMDEFERNKLHSGSKEGPVVKSRKQAVAIALNQAGLLSNKKRVDESLESILEEIAYNLQEQFVNIYENGNYDMMNEFLNSLTEEQAELLGLSEEGGILNRVFGRPLAQRQRIEAGQEPITGGTISSGIPAGRQVAAKRQAAADTLAKVQAQRSDYTPQTADVNRARAAAATAGGGGATNATTRSPAPELPEVNTRRADQTDGPGYSYRPPAPAATTPGAQPVAPATTPPAPGSSGPPPASGSSPRPPAPGSSPRPPRQQQPAADRSTASTGGSFAGQPEWAQRAFNPDKGG